MPPPHPEVCELPRRRSPGARRGWETQELRSLLRSSRLFDMLYGHTRLCNEDNEEWNTHQKVTASCKVNSMTS
ncbi:hypothetical protein Y1Q_0001327 [Alligator mississippiensis]|uniref:Uncharacterized protein n=1 Tax=Alligator mississippiensis TaxID=8496 RepID=A0A151M910_ALLMI|nr:hypothetical protein Y1Q_0001327 [Alligator mississippiensis]